MLKGRTALIVEEEFLIALDLQRVLEGQGIAHILFARTPAEAMQFRAEWPLLALALVEIRGDDTPAEDLIGALLGVGVPVVLLTTDDMRRAPPAYPGLALVVKPVPEAELTGAIGRVLASLV